MVMIDIYITGGLRNSLAEFERALEVTKLVIHKLAISNIKMIDIKYGEIPVLGYRVDAILRVETCNGSLINVGVEIVSKDEDIDKCEKKLKSIKSFGEIDRAFVVKMPISFIEQDVAGKEIIIREVN